MNWINDPRAIVHLCSLVRAQANEFITKELLQSGIEDVVPAHGTVLGTLMRNGEMCMGELAKSTGRKKNSVTAQVQVLEKNGYVSRSACASDARMQYVQLTEKGKNFCAVQAAISTRLLGTVWGDIPEHDQVKVVQVLQQLIDNLGQGAE